MIEDINNIIYSYCGNYYYDKMIEDFKNVVILSECIIYDYSQYVFIGKLKVSSFLLKTAKNTKKYKMDRKGKRRKGKEHFRIMNIDEYMRFKTKNPLIYSKYQKSYIHQ